MSGAPLPPFGGLPPIPGFGPVPTFGAIPGAGMSSGASIEHRLAPLKQAILAGQPDAAMPELSQLLAEHPTNAAVQMAMAAAWMMKGDVDRALPHARLAVQHGQNDAFVLRNAGILLADADFADEALAALRRAMELDPQDTFSAVRIAQALHERRQSAEAMSVLEPIRSWKPDDSPACSMHASILVACGRSAEAGPLAVKQLQRDPGHLGLASVAANACTYADSVDAKAAVEMHRYVGRLIASQAAQQRAGVPMPNYTGRLDPKRRIRVGIISSELRRHSVAYFVEPLLRHLDRQHFEVFAYSMSVPDGVTERLRRFADVWTDMGKLDDVSAAEQIAKDMVDILIETSGYTQGHRLGVVAQRPCPIQISAIGYPHVLAMPGVHHRFVDSTTDPTGSELLGGESLVRLESCFLCYQPPVEAPAVAVRDTASPLVFGSFNNPAKIGPTTLGLWKRILAAAPGSRLVLKARALDDSYIRADVLARAAAAGIPAGKGPGQVEIIPSQDALADHLATYGQIDLALDTFPYNGTTTTCEAMWMGVPVLTVRGEVHASRVGASLLKAVGLPEFIVTHAREAEELIRALATDRVRLATIRAGLRERMRTSTLCDGPGYGRRVGTTLRAMWEQWCARPY